MDSLPSPLFPTHLSFLDVCVCVFILSLRFILSVTKLYCSVPRSLVTSFLLIVFVIIMIR